MKVKPSLILALVVLGMNLLVARSEYDINITAEEEVVVKVNASTTNSTSSSSTAQLDNVVTSMMQNQNFSSYTQGDLDEAKAWFLDPSNHLIDEISPQETKKQANPNDDHYMKERFTLALIYFSNCKEGCTLPKSQWLSTSDHCQWTGVTCNEHQEIVALYLRRKGLSGQFTMLELDHLEKLNLRLNNLSGTFTIAGGYVFSMNALKTIFLARNSFTGVEGLQLLTNLKTLILFGNDFQGEFLITEDNFPLNLQTLNLGQNLLSDIKGINLLEQLEILYLRNAFVQVDDCIFCHNGNMLPRSIKYLDLSRNKLSCIECLHLGRLINLLHLYLGYNSFGQFTITENNFPSNIKLLDLSGNGLVCLGCLSLERLLALQDLYLDENRFGGNLLLRSENLPQTLLMLSLDGNTDLTGIDATNTAVPNMNYLTLNGIDGITIGYELCDRDNLVIDPSDICKISHLKYIVESFLGYEDMHSYPQSDLEDAKRWFLSLESHPFFNWNEVNTRPTRERFVLALLHFANCKDGCTLTSDTGWLTATHHCDWEGVRCDDDSKTTVLNLQRKGLSQAYIMFGIEKLQTLDLAGNNLSGNFHIVGADPFNKIYLNVQKLNLKGNSLQSIQGLGFLNNLKGLYLSYNNFSGIFEPRRYTMPPNVEHLTLDGNQWTSITNLPWLRNLKTLGASDIEMIPEKLAITAAGLPRSLVTFRLNNNNDLRELSLEESDFYQLERITLYGIDYIELDQWLCDKGIIYPPELCP